MGWFSLKKGLMFLLQDALIQHDGRMVFQPNHSLHIYGLKVRVQILKANFQFMMVSQSFTEMLSMMKKMCLEFYQEMI